MNISKGLHHTIYHPRLIIIPLLVNVIFTFIEVVGVYSLSTLPFLSFDIYLPYGFLPLDNMHFIFHGPFINNWLLTSIATIVLIFIKSYALSMYLGSMKCFLEGSDNTYSILKIAPYYFKRMVQFSIIQFVISCMLILFIHIYWPLAIITILIVLFYLITPFMIVLEDISVWEAIVKSPKRFLSNFSHLLLIGLLSLVLFFLVTMLPLSNRLMAFYVIMLLSSFIGTTIIFAIMNCLYTSIYKFSLPFKRVWKSRRYFVPLWIAALLLPLIGALLTFD